MKRRMKGLLLTAMAFLLLAQTAFAGDFLFGEETKGFNAKISEDTDMTVRLLLQPRLDFGDTIKSKDGKSYESSSDTYLRRMRLEISGSFFTKAIKYNLTLAADNVDKAGVANAITVHYAYVEWDPAAAFGIRFGKERLPYSRIALTSDTKQLLIERPVSVEDAKKLFGKTDAYYQPAITVKGHVAGGTVAYEAAAADGWQNGEAVHTGRTVFKANPVVMARLEFSPPGLTENKKSDAPLGVGRHLTLGIDVANQSGIEYKENNFKEKRTLFGADLSGHYEGLTGQVEYNGWKVDSGEPAIGKTEPRGWYAQAGWFIKGYNIEPAVRYEVYDQDSNKSGMKEKSTTTGVNWYGKGHSFKVGFNRVTTEYEKNAVGRLANDDRKNVYQIQTQLYF
ncbi:MAG: hypothetical protein HY883_02540 [Deltaproteobacteria bacterium]|nr:hypothetical protein [Deltaproteobacteria bacterium]